MIRTCENRNLEYFQISIFNLKIVELFKKVCMINNIVLRIGKNVKFLVKLCFKCQFHKHHVQVGNYNK